MSDYVCVRNFISENTSQIISYRPVHKMAGIVIHNEVSLLKWNSKFKQFIGEQRFGIGMYCKSQCSWKKARSYV